MKIPFPPISIQESNAMFFVMKLSYSVATPHITLMGSPSIDQLLNLNKPGMQKVPAEIT